VRYPVDRYLYALYCIGLSCATVCVREEGKKCWEGWNAWFSCQEILWEHSGCAWYGAIVRSLPDQPVSLTGVGFSVGQPRCIESFLTTFYTPMNLRKADLWLW